MTSKTCGVSQPLVLSFQTKGFYDAIRVLLRLLRREIKLEVVRKYIPREA